MPTDHPKTADSAPSRGLILSSGGLFALIAVSALGGIGLAGMPLPRPAWTLFGFEVVVAVSAILGLCSAKSGWRIAPAMGLATLGGCIGAASLLGYLSLQPPIRGGVNLTPFVAIRCLAASGIGLLALVAAMQGDRRAWTTLFKGILAGAPAAAGLGLFVLPQGKQAMAAIAGLGGFAAFGIGLVLFLALTASASAGVHLVIRAFQTAGKP